MITDAANKLRLPSGHRLASAEPSPLSCPRDLSLLGTYAKDTQNAVLSSPTSPKDRGLQTTSSLLVPSSKHLIGVQSSSSIAFRPSSWLFSQHDSAKSSSYEPESRLPYDRHLSPSMDSQNGARHSAPRCTREFQQQEATSRPSSPSSYGSSAISGMNSLAWPSSFQGSISQQHSSPYTPYRFLGMSHLPPWHQILTSMTLEDNCQGCERTATTTGAPTPNCCISR